MSAAFAAPLVVRLNSRRARPAAAPRPRPRRAARAVAAPPAAAALRAAIAELAGTERGIFRLDAARRAEIAARVAAAEAASPARAPAADGAAAVGGAWRLLYTTLTILGRRRVKLAIGTEGRPGFVRLGEFYQVVDCDAAESRSVVVFKMAIGGEGTFTIRADYEAVGDARVQVQTRSAVLAPARLQALLGENVALLTQIFDPTGFLDITYLDDDLRVGRDDRGNLFVLERCELPPLEGAS